MIEVVFIFPSEDGVETAFGEQWRFQCSEADSVQVLFGAIRRRSGRDSVRLSMQSTTGDTVALRALHPQSSDSVVSVGLQSGSRVVVDFEPSLGGK